MTTTTIKEADMGWCDDTGKHEGWIQPIFNDGEEGTGSSSAAGIIFDAYTERERVRPYSEISHLRMKCECGWTGTTVAIVDMPAEQVHRQYNEPTGQGEERFLNEWRRHIAPDKATAQLADTADRIAELERALPAQVEQARVAGASWADVGRALGVTKQAAQQRYGALSVASSTL